MQPSSTSLHLLCLPAAAVEARSARRVDVGVKGARVRVRVRVLCSVRGGISPPAYRRRATPYVLFGAHTRSWSLRPWTVCMHASPVRRDGVSVPAGSDPQA